MTTLILVSIIVLLFFNAILFISLRKIFSYNEERQISHDISRNRQEEKNISIIISVKNEKEKIKTLVGCLKELLYPQDKYEIIIIDDNSTDGTYTGLLKVTENLKNFFVKELKTTGLSGKREALTFGINNSHFPYILITDADCQPQQYWLEAYSKMFSVGNDMLFGIAPFYQNKNLINKVSCFENLRNTLFSFTLTKAGIPYTASARNFGFTRKAFEKLGGYKNTKDTLSGDDDLLLREAVKAKMKIGLVDEEGSFVYSETKKTFKEYFQQRARHTQTSFHYLIKHQLILGLWHLLNLFFLLSPLLMLINSWFGILLPVKLIADIILIKPNDKKFGYSFTILEIIYLQIIYEVLLIVHFFNARFTKIKWK